MKKGRVIGQPRPQCAECANKVCQCRECMGVDGLGHGCAGECGYVANSECVWPSLQTIDDED